MYPKSTSSIGLWSDKVLSSSLTKQSHSKQHQNRKAVSNSELVSDFPDLSHLSEEERKIIQAVIERQKAEEENDFIVNRLSIKSNTNQNLNSIASRNHSLLHNDQLKLKKSQRHSISDIAQETKQRYGSVDTGNVCDICKKIKFTNSGVGRICFSCKSRCCIRCSLKYITKTKEIWMCLICKKKQDDLIQSTISSKKISSKIEIGQGNHANAKRKLPNLIHIKQLSQDESSTRYHDTVTNLTNKSENSSKLVPKSRRISMSLKKQISLTNQPGYLKDLNEINECQQSQSSKHSSNQELKNNSTSEILYSSPSSSISQIDSSLKKEEINDPSAIFESSRHSQQIDNNLSFMKLTKTDCDTNKNSHHVLQKNIKVKKYQTHTNNSIELDDLPKNSVDKNFQEKEKKGQELKIYEEKLIFGEMVKTKKQPTLPILPVDKIAIKNKLLSELKQRSLNLSDDENQSDDVELADIESNIINYRNGQRYQNEDNNGGNFFDEEIRSITEYTNDEMEFESASLTSKNVSCSKSYENSQQNEISSSVENCLVRNLQKEEILAQKINKFLSPVDWKLTKDGNKMRGHIVLKKSMINNSNSLVNSSSNSTIDSATDFNLSLSFGMKVIGGRPDPITHQLCAYIIKLKKDSIADTIGKLQVNDEIVKWNGKLLRGLSFDEVYSIINKSKQEAQIDLVVERRLKYFLKNLQW